MTPEEKKDLLLQDLSARLPYGVKCAYLNTKNELKVGELLTVWCKEKRVFIDKLSIDYDGCDCIGVIPYLFPLSSMTEEQAKELEKIDPEFYSLICENGNRYVSMDVGGYDWLNKNHFDYRGLIEKSLALDATRLNIY